MERERIESIVKSNLAEVIEIDVSDLDSESSMADLGASSLDIVEVISLTMREMKVKVPRSELANLENMSQLVDLIAILTLGDGRPRAAGCT